VTPVLAENSTPDAENEQQVRKFGVLACLACEFNREKSLGGAASRMASRAIRPSGILIRDFQEQEDEVRGACNANARRLNAERARAACVYVCVGRRLCGSIRLVLIAVRRTPLISRR
jgi:hypothetical protein